MQMFILVTYSFELYMLPLSLLLLFIKAYLHKSIIDQLAIKQSDLEVKHA